MQIGARYSHLNGEEYLLVHQLRLWEEVQSVIEGVDAFSCRTKVSREKTMMGKRLYSPEAMNEAFKQGFESLGWQQRSATAERNTDERFGLPLGKTVAVNGATAPVIFLWV